MIIALAGRRIDVANAEPARFPAENAEAVKQRITEFLQSHQVTGLVCAAACGADILALEVADALGLRRRVVLPLDSPRFRAMSVADRGGDWGARYDQIITVVSAADDLIEATLDPDDGQTWYTGNLDILAQAQTLAAESKTDVAAPVVGNGTSRGDGDVAEHFKTTAAARGFGIAEILTL